MGWGGDGMSGVGGEDMWSRLAWVAVAGSLGDCFDRPPSNKSSTS